MFAGKSWLAVATVIAGLLLPSQAMAQYEAYTRVDLNLRVGPDTGYGVIDVIPYGDPVHVIGCLNGVEWCDVEWYGLRGWVAAYYLVQPGTSVYLPQVYAQIGLPIIVFSFDSYHDRYYRDRPWYKKRVGIWQGEKWRRGDKPKNRKEAVKPPKGQDKKQVVLPPKETDKPRKRKDADRPVKTQEVEQPQQKQKQKVERSKKKQEAEAPKQGERKQSSKKQAEDSQKEAKRDKKKRAQEEVTAE
jgi:uncharacterized protein YraI